jgi:hypothetical protein
MLSEAYSVCWLTFNKTPTLASITNRLDPPYEINGRGMPLVGSAAEAGAAKNIGGVLNAMSGKRQGDFKSSKREEAIQNNAAKNGGTNKCEKCGQDLQRTPNKAGQTPPKNQLHVHHDPPIKDGG